MSNRSRTHALRIVADVDPSVLSRVGGILCTLSIVPIELSIRQDKILNQLLLEFRLRGIGDRQIDLMRRKISQLVIVHTETMDVVD